MNSPGTTLTLDGAQASGSVAVEAALWRERFCEVAPRMATAVHRVDGRPGAIADRAAAAAVPALHGPCVLGHLLAALDQAGRGPHRRPGGLARRGGRRRARAHRVLLGPHGCAAVAGGLSFDGDFNARKNRLTGRWELKSPKVGWQPWIELELVPA